jgi:hypothetical protein
MEAQLVFDISVLMGLVVWGIIGARDIWPALRRRPRAQALRPLLLLHAFRFVGLAFLVPGVVSPDLPDGFARPAAYGDLTTYLTTTARLELGNNKAATTTRTRREQWTRTRREIGTHNKGGFQ